MSLMRGYLQRKRSRRLDDGMSELVEQYVCDVLRHERRHSVAKHLVEVGSFLIAEVKEVRERLHPGRLSNREAACQLRVGEPPSTVA